MYSRVTTVQVLPGRMEELVELYESTILPAARAQQGFVGSLLLRDPDEGKAMLITWWDSKADMEAGETSGHYREELARVAPLITKKHTTERFDASGG